MPGAGAFRAAVVAAASAAAVAYSSASPQPQQQQQGGRRAVVRARKNQAGLSISAHSNSLTDAQQQEALESVLQAVDQSNSLAGILQDPCDPFLLAADRRLAAATAVLHSCSGQGLLQQGSSGGNGVQQQQRLSGPQGAA
jgi:hypothetical protein